MLCRYSFDTSVGVILWQIGLFGYAHWDPSYQSTSDRLSIFVEYMSSFYDLDHEIILYGAAEAPLGKAKVLKLPLRSLPDVALPEVATLYIPPKQPPTIDLEMAKRLGIKV